MKRFNGAHTMAEDIDRATCWWLCTRLTREREREREEREKK